MRLSFQDIEYFLTVSRSTSRLKAAESLGITQPALCRAIQRVETAFGLVLLTRHARGVRMTREGEKLIAVLQAVSAGYSRAARLIAESQGSSGSAPPSDVPRGQPPGCFPHAARA